MSNIKKEKFTYRGGSIQTAFPETLANGLRIIAAFFVIDENLHTPLTRASFAESMTSKLALGMPDGTRPNVDLPTVKDLEDAAENLVTVIAPKLGISVTEPGEEREVLAEKPVGPESYPRELMQAEQMVKSNPYTLFSIGRLPFRTVDAYLAWWSASGGTWSHVTWSSPVRMGAMARAAYQSIIERTSSALAPLKAFLAEVHNLDVSATYFPPHDMNQALFVANALANGYSSALAIDRDTGEEILGLVSDAYKEMECQIVSSISGIKESGRAHRWSPTDDEIMAAASGVPLDPSQKAALRGAARSGVAVFTGFPGSGKSTVLSAVAALYHNRIPEAEIIALAPTGSAAQRVTECGVPAATIHSRLHIVPESEDILAIYGNGFDLPYNAIFLIDEVSMIDTPLMACLLEAAHSKNALAIVFFGDVDQLPPIGPGEVLKAFLGADGIPVFQLTEDHRRAPGTRLLSDNLQRIRNREIMLLTPEMVAGNPKYFGDQSFSIRYLSSDEDVAQSAIEEVLKLMPDNTAGQSIAVITPLRKDAFTTGSNGINRALHSAYKMPKMPEVAIGEAVREEKGIDKNDPPTDPLMISPGDVVYFTKNMEIEQPGSKKNHPKFVRVFNGMKGIVYEVTPSVKAGEGSDRDCPASAVILVKGSRITVTGHDLEYLTLGYSITVHKAQGAEMDVVIVLLSQTADRLRMGSRELVYTAISRAKRKCIILVGPSTSSMSLLESALTSARVPKRLDGLEYRLKALNSDAEFE